MNANEIKSLAIGTKIVARSGKIYVVEGVCPFSGDVTARHGDTRPAYKRIRPDGLWAWYILREKASV